jgi:hypothetical protein
MAQEGSGTAGAEGRAFEYYRTIVELGTAELAHHRTRFFENVRINLAVLAGIAVLMAADIGSDNRILFVSVLIIYGILGSYQWIRQTRESVGKLDSWRSVAARIEASEQFRAEMGGLDVKAWSRPEIMAEMEHGGETGSSGGKRHVIVASFWLVFYVLMAVVLYFDILASYVKRI